MATLLARWLALALLAGLLVSGCAPATGRAAPRATAQAAQVVTAPAATPTATPAMNPTEERLAGIARQALGSLGGQVSGVSVSYDAQKAAATITITVSDSLPNTDAKVAAAYAQIRLICYRAFLAVWASGVPLRETTALVLGPIQDEYANIITDWYGVAVVEAATAQRTRWATLSPDAAWNLYDQHMLRISFVLFD
jgi:hypothetical protein